MVDVSLKVTRGPMSAAFTLREAERDGPALGELS